MPELTLSFISAFNERVEPLMNGTVQAVGIEMIPTYSHPAETFWRQLKFQEFEVAEMSMSSFLIARSQGVDMIALPVFPSRRLFQTEISYHVDSGVTEPGELAGKRLGVAEYQQTAALWTAPVASLAAAQTGARSSRFFPIAWPRPSAFRSNTDSYRLITPTSSAAISIENIPGSLSISITVLSEPRRLRVRSCWKA